MSPVMHDSRTSTACFPRVSGDEPPFVALQNAGAKFSPRERG